MRRHRRSCRPCRCAGTGRSSCGTYSSSDTYFSTLLSSHSKCPNVLFMQSPQVKPTKFLNCESVAARQLQHLRICQQQTVVMQCLHFQRELSILPHNHQRPLAHNSDTVARRCTCTWWRQVRRTWTGCGLSLRTARLPPPRRRRRRRHPGNRLRCAQLRCGSCHTRAPLASTD